MGGKTLNKTEIDFYGMVNTKVGTLIDLQQNITKQYCIKCGQPAEKELAFNVDFFLGKIPLCSDCITSTKRDFYYPENIAEDFGAIFNYVINNAAVDRMFITPKGVEIFFTERIKTMSNDRYTMPSLAQMTITKFTDEIADYVIERIPGYVRILPFSVKKAFFMIGDTFLCDKHLGDNKPSKTSFIAKNVDMLESSKICHKCQEEVLTYNIPKPILDRVLKLEVNLMQIPIESMKNPNACCAFLAGEWEYYLKHGKRPKVKTW